MPGGCGFVLPARIGRPAVRAAHAASSMEILRLPLRRMPKRNPGRCRWGNAGRRVKDAGPAGASPVAPFLLPSCGSAGGERGGLRRGYPGTESEEGLALFLYGLHLFPRLQTGDCSFPVWRHEDEWAFALSSERTGFSVLRRCRGHPGGPHRGGRARHGQPILPPVPRGDPRPSGRPSGENPRQGPRRPARIRYRRARRQGVRRDRPPV